MTTTSNAVTIGSIKNLIDIVAIESRAQGQDISIDKNRFEEIVEGVNKDLDLRDYLMGLPIEYTLDECVNIMDFFINNLLDDERVVPFYTVLSAYNYELGDKVKASAYLSRGLQSNYPLASLLNRVYSAGWAIDAFAGMRDELHPKVVKALEEKANDNLI
jgi:hypothetical protein